MVAIFISYRRKPSASLANYIELALRPTPIQVFLDVKEEFGAGRFPKRLERGLANSQIVVSLLADTTLESEWVRKELALARQYNKAIIPVFQESFAAPPENKRDPDIANLLAFDAVYFFDIKNVYIEPAMDALKNRILRTEGVEPITAPANAAPVDVGGYQVQAVTPPVAVPKTEALSQPTGKLEIRILGDLSQFHEQTFIGAISGMVGVKPDEIKILYTRPGSIILGVQLPYDAALHFYYGFTGQWSILQNQTRLPPHQPSTTPRPRRMGRRWPARLIGATSVLTIGVAGGYGVAQQINDDCSCITTSDTGQNGITSGIDLPTDSTPRAPSGRGSATPTATVTRTPTDTPTPPPTSESSFPVSVDVSRSPVAFRQVTSRANIVENYTILDKASLNGNPDAMVFVEPDMAVNPVPIGVWYNGESWTIYNETRDPMPSGAIFSVVVTYPSETVFQFQATDDNIKADSATIDYYLLNDNPNAQFRITPVFRGVYNPAFIKVQYDDLTGLWFVYNVDGTFMQPGVTFNIWILEP